MRCFKGQTNRELSPIPHSASAAEIAHLLEAHAQLHLFVRLTLLKLQRPAAFPRYRQLGGSSHFLHDGLTVTGV